MGDPYTDDDGLQIYPAKLSTRTKLHYLKNIRQKLSAKPERLTLFKSTVFGPWINIKTQDHDNHLLHYLLQHQREVKNHDINTPFYFDIGPHCLEFGRQDMCLILGFRFGDVSFAQCHKRQSGFGKRILAFLREKKYEKGGGLKIQHLVKIINDPFDFVELTNDDAVRLCLVLILENILMGHQERNLISNDILVLVDDLYAWNAFPWGEYIWAEFHNKIYHANIKVRARHLLELETQGSGYTATYTLCGFAFALKIWLLETFPNATNWWVKDYTVIPRALAWNDGQKFLVNDYDLLFGSSEIVRLTPTDEEKNLLWWRSSVDYFRKFMKEGSFDDVQPTPAVDSTKANTPSRRRKMPPRKSTSVIRTEVHRSTHIRTEVRKFVEQGSEEMECSATIEAQMAFMQQQINQLRQVVRQLKPDGVNDLPNMDEDEPAKASLAAQMAFMQQQINGLQKFLQHFKPDGVSGPSSNAGTYVEQQSTQSDCNMDVDEDPKSTGIDDKDADIDATRNAQDDVFSSVNDLSTQEVQEVVGNLVGSPGYPTGFEEVNNEDAHLSEDQVMNESHLFSSYNSDVPVKEDVPVNGVINDDQHVADDEVMNDPQFSDSPFNMDNILFDNEQNVPVNNMMSEQENAEPPFSPGNISPVPMVERKTFDCEKKNIVNEDQHMMSEQETVEPPFSPVNISPVPMVDVKTFDCETSTVNIVRVPFEREKKMSKVFQSPYTQQPSTTPRVLRRRTKKHVPGVIPKVIGADGKEIRLRPWKENLQRSPLSTAYRAFIHPEIMGFLDDQKKIKADEDLQLFRFPWGGGGTVANHHFWLRLFGRESSGWLTDSHVGLAVDLMMHFRPPNADWVMINPFFSTQILKDEGLPLYYADGVTNGIPWFREGIEKVFFPINEPDVHWTLGEFSISTGVITLYDSLGSQLDKNLSEWSRNFRRIFQRQLPVLLAESEVMERKNIDPDTYSIKFRYAEDLPRQGGKYGDCGVWVIIFLYRLTHNLHLKFKKPVQVALAYREHLGEFFWKHRIPVPRGEQVNGGGV